MLTAVLRLTLHLTLLLIGFALALGAAWGLLKLGSKVASWSWLGFYCLLLFLILPVASTVILTSIIYVFEKKIRF